MKTSPAPSTATPAGPFNPLPTVVCAPPPAGTSTTRLLPGIRDEDIARSIHRHTSGAESAAHRGLRAAAGWNLHHAVLPVSAMKTSPAPSTATPAGTQCAAHGGLRATAGRNLYDAVVAGIRDEDIARTIHRHTSGGLIRCRRWSARRRRLELLRRGCCRYP